VNRIVRLAILVSACALGPCGRAAASAIYVGTMGTSSGFGEIWRLTSTGWTNVTPPPVDVDGDGFAESRISVVWDLETFEDTIVACGELENGSGFIARRFGSAWTTWTIAQSPMLTGTVTSLAVMDGRLYASTQAALLEPRSGAWAPVGPSHFTGRMTVDECSAAPILYLGSNGEDDFLWYDRTAPASCAAACPAIVPPLCAAGCYGGSCVHSMTVHAGIARAGAYGGAMYDWDDASSTFVRATPVPGGGHVQALASYRGMLVAGTSEGELWRGPAPWVQLADFTHDEPVSALEVDPETGLLWIGHGGVPFGSARRGGLRGLRTWDGASFVDRGGDFFRAEGIVAIEALAPPNTSTCDAGPDRIVECAGAATPVTLSGAATLTAPCSPGPTTLTWTGGFVEGTVTGTRPTVHFPGPGDYGVTLTAESGSLRTSCGVTITVRDSRRPEVWPPAYLQLDCAAPIPPATVASATVTDACDPAPAVSLRELRQDGPCPQTYALVREWTAVDDAGNSGRNLQRIDVTDGTAPALSGVPDDGLDAPCSAVPAPLVTAADDCDPSPGLALAERRVPGPCPQTYDLLRTWTATDACRNTTSVTRTVHVSDTVAPVLGGLPADGLVAPCDAIPAPLVTATDDCDSAARVTLAETRIDGPCPHAYDLVRTWTGRDACGNATAATRTLHVRDLVAPVLAGVPAGATVECDAVPAPAPVTASDACDPAPVVRLAQTRIDGRCPGEYRLVRTWTATDACGNAASASQELRVVDTRPPLVVPGSSELGCIWPPNHRMVPFHRSAFTVVATDDCSDPVTWRLAGCASSQPDDGLGDGSFAGDCAVSPDGSTIAVRAERSGRDRGERRYGVEVVATDACGNESAATLIGFIVVPHDFREGCVGGR
jgi:hypothetical protein